MELNAKIQALEIDYENICIENKVGHLLDNNCLNYSLTFLHYQQDNLTVSPVRHLGLQCVLPIIVKAEIPREHFPRSILSKKMFPWNLSFAEQNLAGISAAVLVIGILYRPWLRCDMLCILPVLCIDITWSKRPSYGSSCLSPSGGDIIGLSQHHGRDSHQILLNDKDKQVLDPPEFRTGRRLPPTIASLYTCSM